MELADVLDSKSSGSDTVPVRPRSPAPKKSVNLFDRFFYIEVQMKVAYFGFDLFFDCLKQIKESGNEIVKIFTCKVDGVYEFSDKVYKFAKDNNIEITDKKVEVNDIINLVEDGCNLLFSAGYYYKIPVINNVVGVNIHPALLPIGKGAWPQPITILKRLKTTGITLHKLSEEFDSGDVVLQQKFSVSIGENLETLTKKYAYYAKNITKKFFSNTSKYLSAALPQQMGEYWHEPTVTDMTFSIDDTFDKIDRITRAFYGFKCFLKIEDKTIEILKSKCVRSIDCLNNGYVDKFKINGGWLVILNYA